MWRNSLLGAVLWLLAGATANALGGEPPRPRFTVSEETTVLLGPLRGDGCVDYVAALNEMCSEGVTPENNAAVLLMKAFGPSEVSEPMRERFFRMLGIEPLPEQGNYLVDSVEYIQNLVSNRVAADASADAVKYREKLEDDYRQLMKRPWSKDEFPEMAGWLKRNEEPLRWIVEGTRRPRYYAPLIASDDEDEPGTVLAILLPMLQEMREAARLLKARAMLRLGEGEVDAAWGDLAACHRLARLAGQDPTMIGTLVCIAIDGIACEGDAQLIHHGNLTAERARRMLADLKSLDGPPPMVRKIDTADRYMFADAVCMVSGGQVTLSDFAVGGPTERQASWIQRLVTGVFVDWDVVLRMGNSWYDRMVEAWEQPTHAERAEASAALEEELRAISKTYSDPKKLAGSFFTGKSPRQTVSRHLGSIFIALLTPAASAAQTAEDRGTTIGRLNEIGFAMAGYRADHGRYPKDLSELAPKYIDDLPVDLFTGKSYVYKPHDDGFLIYSLGPNMEDNGGKVYYLDQEDAAAGEDTSRWDDHRLRIPPQ